MRYTIWSLLIGGTFYGTAASCILQTQTQRYMCASSTREAQKYSLIWDWVAILIKIICRATWINFLMLALLLLLCGLVGLLIYAKYYNCDPMIAKLVSKPDQVWLFIVLWNFWLYIPHLKLYPLFVMETFHRYPGLSGLFIAAVLSGSLRYRLDFYHQLSS